jgi:Protein of unknown function (DUF2786)
MDKETAIKKIKLLLKLANDPNNANEAANAQEKANQLIAEFSLLPEDYEEKIDPPIYTDDHFLFATVDPLDWQRSIALIATNKFDCYVIEEVNTVIATGENIYRYYTYGHESDMLLSKHLFNFLVEKTNGLVAEYCKGESELYISSYLEGAVNGIRTNVANENYTIHGLVKQEQPEVAPQAIAKTDAPKKEKPPFSTKEQASVHLKEKPLDIYAYFQGENDAANNIHIGEFAEGKLFFDELDDNGFFLNDYSDVEFE